MGIIGLISVCMFLYGLIHKINTIRKLPLFLPSQIHPIPTSPIRYIIKEVLIFKEVKKRNVKMWVFTLFLHWGVYLYLTYAALIALDLLVFKSWKWHVNIGLFSCSIGAVGSTGLIVLRLSKRSLRYLTNLKKWLNLLLLTLMFTTGLFCALRGVLAPAYTALLYSILSLDFFNLVFPVSYIS